MARRDKDELRIGEIGRELARWALGLGLLRVHLAVFTVGAVGLVLLDLYRTPAELGTIAALRLWMVVLACHAAALLAGWSTWRAVRPHRLPTASAVPGGAIPAAAANGVWPTNGTGPNGHAPVPPVAANGTGAAAFPAPARNGGAPAPVPLPPRGRFNPPASQPPVVGHGRLPRLDTAEAAAKLRAGAAGLLAAGRTGWRDASRAARSATAAIADRVLQPAAAEAGDRAGTPEVPPSPPPGWPAPPAAPDVPPGWEAAVRPPGRPGAASQGPPPATLAGWPGPPPVAAGLIRPADLPAGEPANPAGPQPASAAAPPTDEPPLPAETEWTWMEAAAAAWLARRDAEAGHAGPSTSAAPAAPGEPPAPGDAGGTPSRP